MTFDEAKTKFKKKYGMKFFNSLDDTVRKPGIVTYYQETYGTSYHLVTLCQLVSKQRRLVDIDEEIQRYSGVKISSKFFAANMGPKIRRLFGNDIIPKPASKFRMEKSNKNARKKKKPLYMNECVQCGEEYEVDIEDHPANLCACLKCYPYGLGFVDNIVRIAAVA